jgi:hypothetical protein
MRRKTKLLKTPQRNLVAGGHMSRFHLHFAMAFIAVVPPGIAKGDGPADKTAAFACQTLAVSVLTGSTALVANSVELCNVHEQCLNTKRFIEQHRKTVPELTCASVATSPPLTARQFEAIYENACAMASTEILTGVALGNRWDEIALCNEHPNKDSCRTAKAFIAQRNHGDDGGVNCE